MKLERLERYIKRGIVKIHRKLGKKKKTKRQIRKVLAEKAIKYAGEW